jgi:hypothetical protein
MFNRSTSKIMRPLASINLKYTYRFCSFSHRGDYPTEYSRLEKCQVNKFRAHRELPEAFPPMNVG